MTQSRCTNTHTPRSGVDIRYPIQALQDLYEMRTILEEVKAQQVTYERPPVTTFYATHLPPAFNETNLSPGTCVSWACKVLPKSHLAYCKLTLPFFQHKTSAWFYLGDLIFLIMLDT